MSISDSVISSSELIRNIHGHRLIKNEDYHARQGDLCHGCGLLLNKSSSVVYHCIYFSSAKENNICSHFFLHVSCALLPIQLNHPKHKHDLSLYQRSQDPQPVHVSRDSCDICGIKPNWFAYYCNCQDAFQICLACVLPVNSISIYTPYHAHKLTLLQSLASFQCHACHSVDTDFSYMCYTCPFWIHLGCSKLPTLFECKIHHKHPLILAYSLPQNYRTFLQSCRICREELDPSNWLYYCPDCRFFAHIKCATSPPPKRWIKDSPVTKSDFVHLPVPEHESLLQQCIKKEKISWLKGAAMKPPNYINHWSHEHQLLLRNKTEPSNADEEGMWPICNGCTEFISTNDDVFYECIECDYILHRYCAQFPEEMQLHIGGEHVGIQPSVYDIWSCTRCGGYRNGTQMQSYRLVKPIISVKLDSGCAVLPKEIKHQAHHHHLILCDFKYLEFDCIACSRTIRCGDPLFTCYTRTCNFFYIHIKCALRPLRVTHPWDRHPLCLIFSPEEVVGHPHEFHCEFCSEEIDTNYWFYHCNVCDLSFHFEECIDLFSRYSKVKFGATNIKIEAHQHGLTFVLNKKQRQPCKRCHKDTYYKPVLECTPCKFIQHAQPDLCK